MDLDFENSKDKLPDFETNKVHDYQKEEITEGFPPNEEYVGEAMQQVGASVPVAESGSSTATQQEPPDTEVIRCSKFLATLLRLSSEQSKGVAMKVRTLTEELIDGRIGADAFTSDLHQVLNSAPPPGLLSFLKNSLPGLQQALEAGKLVIEGIKPPDTKRQADSCD